MSERRPEEATELIYPPQPSWLPLFAAAGIALVLVGLFIGLFYTIVGALIALRSIYVWIRDTGRQVERLPREQIPSAAVLPAVPPRSGSR